MYPHRQLSASYNTAWHIRHKLMQVMMERDRKLPLAGRIELDDAYLGGELSSENRDRCAPSKMPIMAAVETGNNGCPLQMKLIVVEGFRLAGSIRSPATSRVLCGVPTTRFDPSTPMSHCARPRCPKDCSNCA